MQILHYNLLASKHDVLRLKTTLLFPLQAQKGLETNVPQLLYYQVVKLKTSNHFK